MQGQSTHRSRRQTSAIVFALAFPSLITWVYFDLLSASRWMAIAYGTGKTVQFAFPLVWALLGERRPPRMARPSRSGLPAALMFGMVIVAAMLALYYGWLKQSPLLAAAPELVREKLEGVSVRTPLGFLAVALFYALVHSWLEEYYWRWFVFGRLREMTTFPVAAAVSSLGFMAHHVIVLYQYMSDTLAAVAFFSLCVAVGGVVWAWLYEKTHALYGPWLSHLVLDAGIMWLGYDLLWRS